MLRGSFERSVSSGTLVCMRKAISYCAMRVCDFRVAGLVQPQLVERGEVVEHARGASGVDAVRVREVQHRIALRAELHALVAATAESRCPTGDRRAADRPGCREPCEISTTNAGRSRFSLPRP